MKKFLFYLGFLSLFLAQGVSATNITGCTNITSAGVYTLNQSIVNNTGFNIGAVYVCININSSDILFDGQGFTLDGDDNGTFDTVGIYSPGSNLTNLTIKNTIITDWSADGIFSDSIEDIGITNLSITNNTMTSNFNGIRIDYGINNSVINNNVSYNDQTGIYFLESSNSIILNNNISNNIFYGITLTQNSINNTIKHNRIELNGNRGLNGLDATTSLNNIYDNVFNNSINVVFGLGTPAQTWYLPPSLSTNILSGPYLVGNAWFTPTGTGYSETCTDSNNNGVCDYGYTLDANNRDCYPLSNSGGTDNGTDNGCFTGSGGSYSPPTQPPLTSPPVISPQIQTVSPSEQVIRFLYKSPLYSLLILRYDETLFPWLLVLISLALIEVNSRKESEIRKKTKMVITVFGVLLAGSLLILPEGLIGDVDGDGVPDTLDLCPSLAAFTASGCVELVQTGETKLEIDVVVFDEDAVKRDYLDDIFGFDYTVQRLVDEGRYHFVRASLVVSVWWFEK